MIKSSNLLLCLLPAFLAWQCAGIDDQQNNAGPKSKEMVTAAIAVDLPAYQTLVAQPADERRLIKLTGRTQTIEALQIKMEIQGKTLPTEQLLNEGVRYRRGQLLVRIDDTRYRYELQSQRSNFHSALVRIMSQIQLDYPEAYPNWDQYLLDLDATAELTPLPEVKDSQLRFFLSANNIFTSYYQLKSAEALLPKYRIYAPFTGVITQGNLTPGTVVSPGVPIASFGRSDVYELKAAVSASDIDRLQPGQQLTLTHNNTGDSWRGTIHRIGGNIDPGTQAVPVFIRLSGPGLREGLFLSASLETDHLEQVVTLPLEALTRDNQVHVIQDSTIVLRDVKPVHFDGQNVWVQGLENGTVVIREAVNQPIAGTRAASKS